MKISSNKYESKELSLISTQESKRLEKIFYYSAVEEHPLGLLMFESISIFICKYRPLMLLHTMDY
jgi:hypothetical protein